MPIFDAMDGPVHASLRDPVRSRRLRGWALVLAGVIGLVLLLALSEESEAIYAVFLAAVLTPVFWWLDGRGLRQALAKTRPVTAQATIEPSVRARRALVRPASAAVLIVVTILTGYVSAPVGVVLAVGVGDLITAGTLSRWERRHGKTLLVAAGTEELYAR